MSKSHVAQQFSIIKPTAAPPIGTYDVSFEPSLVAFLADQIYCVVTSDNVSQRSGQRDGYPNFIAVQK